MLKTKSVWSAISHKRDGLLILVTRIRGRGLPASRYDVWMANLGPSDRLLRGVQNDRISWAQFSTAYRKELFLDGPSDKRSQTIKNHGQKFTLRLVKRLATASLRHGRPVYHYCTKGAHQSSTANKNSPRSQKAASTRALVMIPGSARESETRNGTRAAMPEAIARCKAAARLRASSA